MSDFWLTLVAFFAATNPAGVLVTMASAPGASRERLSAVVIGLVVAGALLLVAALASDSILDFLEVEPETFRISAGVVMVTVGIYALLLGPFDYPIERGWRGALFPLAFPLLAGPAALAAAISYAEDPGRGETIAAALIVAGASAAAVLAPAGRYKLLLTALTRLTGALLIAIAAGLIVDGIRAV